MNLPIKLANFVKWWFIGTPKRLFVISRRILAMINNSLNFTTNIRLLLTPLYGDYSYAGRLIGFFARIFMIIFGLFFTGVFACVVLTLPIIWLSSPILLWYKIGAWYLFIPILLYLKWHESTKNTPSKKLSELTDKTPAKILVTFRPEVVEALKHLEKVWSLGIKHLIDKPDINYLLKKTEIDSNAFVDKLTKTNAVSKEKLIISAYETAAAQQTRYIELEHLLYAVLFNTPQVQTLLASFGVTIDDFLQTIEWLVSQREFKAKMYLWSEDYDAMISGGTGHGMLGVLTPALDAVSTDFTREIQHGKMRKVVGREQEIQKIAELLTDSGENVLLIGPPGSGKTTIIRGIAYEVMKGTKYKSLNNKRIVSLEIGSLVAGALNQGALAEKINKIIAEVERSGDIILFIDEIHNMAAGNAGNDATSTAAVFSLLEPHLAGNKIQFIGATTLQNYRKYLEPNGAFSRLFHLMEIQQASKQDTIKILKQLAPNFELKHKVFVTYPALKCSVDMSEKLIHERVLPDKAIDILNRVCAMEADREHLVTKAAVMQEIAEMTHVPVQNLTEDETKKLLYIEDTMKNMVIGQDSAINQIGAAVKRARAGIRDENKPIASFLFVGTTGVGKTQTAKSLAKAYFGDAKNMIRLDMSEYQQPDSITRLLGAPDGSTKGILTEEVRTRPFALILLDEIEKAHTSILLTFLQVLDDGRLTDSSGTLVDFTNTIIIATSNTGTRAIQEVFQKSGSLEEMKEAAHKEVREKFAPELLNRFSGIIVFNPLTMADVDKIADLLLADVAKKTEEKGINLSFKPELIKELVKRGYSPEWGARPLARVIEDTVESYVAVKILNGELKQGDSIDLGLECLNQSADIINKWTNKEIA